MESYPPLFREANLNSKAKCPNSKPQPNLDIPLIDFTNLDPKQLGDACREFGTFRLINHGQGVPSSLSSQLHDEAQKILSLPFESKMAAGFMSPVHYFWGSPVPTASVRDVNWLEGLHVPLGKIQPKVEGVEKIDGWSSFRSLVTLYGQHMAHVAKSIFNALAMDLNLDSSVSASWLSESDSFLRIYRYPCCPDTSNHLGMVAHTDSSVLSILNQDEVGGLQILHNNQWFNVTPILDTLIVNLGDLMQAMSDDKYKSLEHRVLVNGSRERKSLCYFAFPMEDGVIISSKYKQFTYKQFRDQVQKDIKTCGSKIGLDHFKI